MDFTIFLNLLIILAIAKIVGEILAKFGYPSVVGEIATGIVLGPSVFALVTPQEPLGLFADMGFLLVLLYAGLSLDVKRLFEATKRGLIVALFNVAVTMILGYTIGKLFNYSDISSVSIGIALTISSVGMGTRVLIDLDRLNTPAGMTLVSVAVIDDISEVLMLGIVLSMASNAGVIATPQLAVQITKVALFFLFIFIAGFHLKIFDRLKRYTDKTQSMGTKLSYVFLITFATMGLAYAAGLHIIIGAFFAGLMLNKAFRDDKEIHKTVMLMTFGLFAPVAYAWVGLNTMLSSLSTNIPLLALIIVAGIGGEILGGFLGSRLVGLCNVDSVIVGIGLTGRAGIELAVIEVMRTAGLIALEVYSSFVILTAISCILMPLMLKLVCSYASKTCAPSTP